MSPHRGRSDRPLGRLAFALIVLTLLVPAPAALLGQENELGVSTDPAHNTPLPCEAVSTPGLVPRSAENIAHIANVCGFVGTDLEFQSRTDADGNVHDYAFVGTMGAGTAHLRRDRSRACRARRQLHRSRLAERRAGPRRQRCRLLRPGRSSVARLRLPAPEGADRRCRAASTSCASRSTRPTRDLHHRARRLLRRADRPETARTTRPSIRAASGWRSTRPGPASRWSTCAATRCAWCARSRRR